MATHYDTLGVATTATTQELRKAYLRRARALHPDRQVGREPADARKAEQAMQQVNVAWDVLSDPSKKAEYDKRLRPRQAAPRPSQSRTTQPTRQRAPQASPSSRSNSTSNGQSSRGIDDSPGDGSVSVWASLPVLLIVGLLLGVLIVTAFAGDGGSDSDTPDPVPENANLDVGDCFIFIGDQPRERSCATGTADGLVVEVGPEPGNCPQNTQSMKDPSSEFFLCWARMLPGSTNTVAGG